MAKPSAASTTARATRAHAGKAVIASPLPYQAVQINDHGALALMAGCADLESVRSVLEDSVDDDRVLHGARSVAQMHAVEPSSKNLEHYWTR
jgi:hypothetical protein